jgi:folate-binding protein YgfZ
MIQLFKLQSGNQPIQWNWITLIGPDARDFLHRLTSVNLNELQPGSGKPGCFLTAQGKIRAYFKLWNFGPDEYAFEFDGGLTGKWKSHLFNVIDQYTFAEKFQLMDVTSELSCVWIFADSSEDWSTWAGNSLAANQTIAIEDEIRICHHGVRDFGKNWISAWARPARLEQWIERNFSTAPLLNHETLRIWRILEARPWIDSEINESVTPLEVGLVDAVANQKGCYPGQEVIERVLALGSPPRRLALMDGIGLVPEHGTPIFNAAEPPMEIGEVTSAAFTEEKFSVLGLVKKIHAKEGLTVQFSKTLSSKGAIIKVAPYAEESV